MEALNNEQVIKPIEQKPVASGQKLEAVGLNVEPKAEIPKEKPLVTMSNEQRFYLGGIVTAILISIIALTVAASANHDRKTDQALIDSFASIVAKNSADRLQNSNAGSAAQPNSMDNNQNNGASNSPGMNNNSNPNLNSYQGAK